MTKRILIVDDLVQAADIRAIALSREFSDIAIEKVFGGQECLDRIQKAPPLDLILLDIDMPDVSGADVIRKVVRMSETPSFKVIPLTAWGRDWTTRWGLFPLCETPDYQRLILPSIDKASEDMAQITERIREALAS